MIFLLFCCSLFAQNKSILDYQSNDSKKCRYGNRVYPDVNCNRGDYKLVFLDNFDGNALDLTKWTIDTGSYYSGEQNNNLYWYCPENIEVLNGILHIKTTRNSSPELHTYSFWDSKADSMVEYTNYFNYNSGQITTKYEFPINGKIEARIKLPSSLGLWPAFWLYGENEYNHSYNEIDIFELMQDIDKNEQYLQLNSYYGQTKNQRVNCPLDITDDINLDDLKNDFHVYTLSWTDSQIRWYIDGNLVRTLYRYKKGVSVFNGVLLYKNVCCTCLRNGKKYFESDSSPKDPMKLILNIAVYRDERAPHNSFTQDEMLVDYVRVYKTVSCDEDRNINSNLFHLNVGCIPGKNDYYITGRNVTFKDSAIVDVCEKHSVTTIASREIIFGDNTNFSSNTNSSFIAYISPCNSQKNVILESVDLETDTIDEYVLDTLEKNNFDSITFVDIDDLQDPIWVYTSLDEDSLFIDIKTNTISNYYVEIKKESDSTIIYQSRNLTNTFISINLLDLEEDIYVINIIDVINNRREQYLLTIE